MGENKQETKQNSVTNVEPWGPQQGYLLDAWSQAKNVYNDRQKSGPYGGEFVATDKSGLMNTAFNDAFKWASNGGMDINNGMLNLGQSQYNQGATAQNRALEGLFSAATADNTQKFLDQANAYANAQDVDGQVRAATYSARRDAAENQLPSLYRAAQGSGNINSDRVAQSEAIINRGLNENSQNLAAQLRAKYISDGLALAQSQSNQNLQATAAAGTLGSTLASQGLGATQNAFQNYGSLAQMQQGAAYGLNQLDQWGIDNGLKKWYNNYQYPQNNLNDMYGIVASGNWGGTTTSSGTSTTTQTPSIGQMIGQGIGIFGSLFSDERFKDIKSGPIGVWENTAPAYLYSYKHDPSQLHIGPMAQEVAQVRPDIVRDVGGALVIDTHKL